LLETGDEHIGERVVAGLHMAVRVVDRQFREAAVGVTRRAFEDEASL
jgi:hypothetical protein